MKWRLIIHLKTIGARLKKEIEAPSPSAALEELVEILRRTGETVGIAKDEPFHVDIMEQRIL